MWEKFKKSIKGIYKITIKGKDGYYLIFPTIVEKFAYLDKVYANDGYDLRRK